VQALRAQAAAGLLRSASDELFARLPGAGSAYLSGLLAGAASGMAQARGRQHIDVVWTGPETRTGAGRLTAAVTTDLIARARREILIVSYATNNEPSIEAGLTAAADRGVEITLVTDRHVDNPGYTGHRNTVSGAPCDPTVLARRSAPAQCGPSCQDRRGG
jgi:phosphatidylserine/phosphatidylglycerophosphate/cardiolipin synthase-like enzyme